MNKKRRDRKYSNKKKFTNKRKKHTHLDLSFEELINLLTEIKENELYIQNNFNKYVKYAQYDEETFREDIQYGFQSLTEPLYFSIWCLYPNNYLEYLKKGNHYDIIVSSISILSNLAEDFEDLYSFTFPELNLFNENIFTVIKNYSKISKRIFRQVEKKIDQGTEDLSDLIFSLSDELQDIINKQSKLLENNFQSEQNILFYTAAIIIFQDILIYQTEITKQNIEDLLNGLTEIAKNKKYDTILEILKY